MFINAAVMMVSLLPAAAGRRLARIEPFGLPLLLVLILTGLRSRLLWPLMVLGMATATWLADIPVDVLTGALRALLG